MAKSVLDAVRMSRVTKGKKWYKARLRELQFRILRIQRAYYQQQRRAVLVFEGWDAAGKGGAIRRMTAKLDPRGYHVIPIGPPTEEEKGRHYLYRFVRDLPPPGTLGIFDRSWYGRVLVERVEGFASKPEWRRAYREINAFERMLVDDDVRVVKFFIHVTEDEQLKRFRRRFTDPYKQWKLTADDFRNRALRSEYQKAIEAMVEKTSTKRAPWNVIGGNHKWHARLRVLDIACKTLGAGVDVSEPMMSDELKQLASEELGVELPVER